MKIDYNQPDDDFGDASARMTRAIFAEGAERAVLLMRHSAREYRRDIHDLENPLTAEGRSIGGKIWCFSARCEFARLLQPGNALQRNRCFGH